MPEVKANPDYQLVMNFLKLIQPGDMDEQSANQLMMIGQRIQNGGSLSDKEREMFQSVVGAMPMEGARASGEITPMSGGNISEAELRLATDTAIPQNLTPEQMDQFMAAKRAAQSKVGSMTDAQKRMAEEEAYFKRLREEQEQMYNMGQQSIQEQMQSAAPMTSPRPMARPMR